MFKEFARRNKVILQFTLIVVAFFGLDKWETIKNIWAALNAKADFSHTLFAWSWWTDDLLGIPYTRLVVFVVLVAIAINAVFTIRTRNRPITILSTDICLTFYDGGARTECVRKQVLHANRPEIAAYFVKLGLDEPTSSYVPDQTTGAEICCGLDHPPGLTVTPSVIASGRVRDLDFVYSSPLPYSWIISLCPNWLLAQGQGRLPSLIDRYLVIQWMRHVVMNEYSGQNPRVSASSTRYTHHRITITLDFSHDTGQRPRNVHDITVRRRLANAVLDPKATETDRAHVYKVNFPTGLARDESLIVSWTRH